VENDYIWSQVSFASNAVWMGLNDIAVEGEWRWADFDELVL